MELPNSTNTNTNQNILKISEDYSINVPYDKDKENIIDIDILDKLSIFDLLAIPEDNKDDKFKYFRNNKYKKNVLKVENYKSRFKFKILKRNFRSEEIEEVKKLITNLNICSNKYKIIYRLIIKENKEKKDEFDIYLGTGNILIKYIFQMEESESEDAEERGHTFWNEFKKHCFNEQIIFYIKLPIEKNATRDKLCSQFFDIINSKEGDKSFYFLDANSPNYRPYSGLNEGNDLMHSIDSQELFSIYNKNNSIFTEQFKDIENKIDNPIIIDCENNKKELIIFLINLEIYYKYNRKNNSTFMVTLEKNAKFPYIYLQIKFQTFKITFDNPGLSLPEFFIICSKIPALLEVIENNPDRLKYDGEYLDGKRYGKGKEFDFKKETIFEGEYLNGERNGQGKEYYFNGKMIFEGKYLNGEKNGQGKEYYFNGKIKFEGIYLNGEKNGQGKEYNSYGKMIFKGEYKDGKRNGKGKEFYNDGITFYEGEFLNGQKEGHGREYYNNKLIFEGEFKKGEKNGKGKEYDFSDGKLYFEGEYQNGNKVKGRFYDEEYNIFLEIDNFLLKN